MIYLAELHDCERDDVVAYFTEEEDAQACCDYFNLISPSKFKEKWKVNRYAENNVNYAKLLDCELTRRVTEKQKMIDEAEAKEFELYKQLREKYGDVE